MKETHDDKILNSEEVAELLDITTYSVRNLAKKGKLPGFKVGKEWRFSYNAIMEKMRGTN